VFGIPVHRQAFRNVLKPLVLDTKRSPITEALISYYKAGYVCIPVHPRKKVPLLETWIDLQHRPPNKEEKREILEIISKRSDAAIAIVAGPVSGDIECIDVDTKHDPDSYMNYIDELREHDFFDLLFIQSTPSGGRHIIYRCPAVGRNQILAKKRQRLPIIETRGQGGYFVVRPSPGYETVQGDIMNLPVLTAEQRDVLLSAARKLSAIDMEPDISQKEDAQWNSLSGQPKRIFKTTEENLRSCIEQIQENQVDVTGSYDDWIRIGFALANEFGELGRQWFHQISKFYVSYKENQDIVERYSREKTDAKYDSLLKGRAPNSVRKIKMGTLFYILGEYKIHPQGELTALQKDRLYQYVQNLGIKRNVLTGGFENHMGEPLDDRLINTMYLKARLEIAKISISLWDKYLLSEAIVEYNPLTDYFDALRWKKVHGNPLETWLDHVEYSDPDMREYVRKWMVSCVASAYGHISEMVLVMISPEGGTGKTEFFKRMLTPFLEEYFAVDQLDREKDSDILMTQKLIILDDEFSGKSKKDASHLKAKVSQHKFSLRRPHGRHNEDIPRLAVLCGASNPLDIINDNTSNRRIIPCRITGRDFEMSDSIDKESLWAELVQVFFDSIESGDDSAFKLNHQDYKNLNTSSEKYYGENMERDYIIEYFSPGHPNDPNSEFMTSTKMREYVSAKSGRVTQEIYHKKFGQELRLLGFEPMKKKVDGVSLRGFWVVKNQGENMPDFRDENIPF